MARLAHLLVTVVKGHLLLTPLVITGVMMLFVHSFNYINKNINLLLRSGPIATY